MTLVTASLRTRQRKVLVYFGVHTRAHAPQPLRKTIHRRSLHRVQDHVRNGFGAHAPGGRLFSCDCPEIALLRFDDGWLQRPAMGRARDGARPDLRWGLWSAARRAR